MNITIIDGHPDPSEGHLNHALADRYAAAAAGGGHTVRRIDIAKIDVPIMRDPKEFTADTTPEIIASTQIDLAWADHIVVFFPLWMSDVPAYLKAYFEQTFRPGFALDYGGRFGFPKQLLKGKTARIVVTMGMPAFIYTTMFGAHAVKLLERMLSFAGISPVASTIIGSVENASERTKRTWFEKMDYLALADGERASSRAKYIAGAVVAAGVAAGAGYLAYALATWARYGAPVQADGAVDELMDRYMSNYEVRLRHGTVVHAPASVAFSAIRLSDVERSPFVRSLFSLRDLVMRAKHTSDPSGLPFDKLTSIGWGVLYIDPGVEIVLGTITQPWRPNSPFRPLPPDEFASFNEPGYAKISLSIRVDEVSSEHCEVGTETRVQTTDPISRARFRRYWALLSPGMVIIRRVLLQQIKSEAEATWERTRAAAQSTT